jgi:hypothetical protein
VLEDAEVKRSSIAVLFAALVLAAAAIRLASSGASGEAGRAWLAGRVIGPPGASYGLARLRVTPSEESAAAPPGPDADRVRNALRGEDPMLATCSETGAFRIGPVPPGRCVLSMVFPSRADGLPSFFDAAGAPLFAEQPIRELELPAGETRVDLELASQWPGALDLAVLVDGAPLPGAVVHLRIDEGGTPIVGVAGADGIARFDHVPTGALLVTVRPPDHAWQHRLAELTRIEPGSRTRSKTEISLHDGRLRFSREDGTALARTRVSVSTTSVRTGMSAWHGTDEGGGLVLRLPVGRYFVDAGPMRLGAPGIEIEWTAHGPSPAEITVRN